MGNQSSQPPTLFCGKLCLASSISSVYSPSQVPLAPFFPRLMLAACSLTGQAHLRPAQGEGGRDEGEAQGRKACCRRVDAGVAFFVLSRELLPQQYLDTGELFCRAHF